MYNNFCANIKFMNESLSPSPEKLNLAPESGSKQGGEIMSPLLETAEKVSEVVNEAQSNNQKQSFKKKVQAPEQKSKTVSDTQIPQDIPAPAVQQVAVRKELEKQTVQWEKQVKKLRKQRNFSAAKMEVLVKKIREYKALVLELVHMTKDALESLYRRFVLKQ